MYQGISYYAVLLIGLDCKEMEGAIITFAGTVQALGQGPIAVLVCIISDHQPHMSGPTYMYRPEIEYYFPRPPSIH